jgi:hypothetical protein
MLRVAPFRVLPRDVARLLLLLLPPPFRRGAAWRAGVEEKDG